MVALGRPRWDWRIHRKPVQPRLSMLPGGQGHHWLRRLHALQKTLHYCVLPELCRRRWCPGWHLFTSLFGHNLLCSFPCRRAGLWHLNARPGSRHGCCWLGRWKTLRDRVLPKLSRQRWCPTRQLLASLFGRRLQYSFPCRRAGLWHLSARPRSRHGQRWLRRLHALQQCLQGGVLPTQLAPERTHIHTHTRTSMREVHKHKRTYWHDPLQYKLTECVRCWHHRSQHSWCYRYSTFSTILMENLTSKGYLYPLQTTECTTPWCIHVVYLYNIISHNLYQLTTQSSSCDQLDWWLLWVLRFARIRSKLRFLSEPWMKDQT